jgi:hypothetical protein
MKKETPVIGIAIFGRYSSFIIGRTPATADFRPLKSYAFSDEAVKAFQSCLAGIGIN